jgi:hypothetical protein
MIGRQARVSIAVMRRWLPHDPGRWCLVHTIPHYVTNQTNSQNAGALPIEEAAQVNVTRVTVSDRQAPPAPAVYGTQMARPPPLW